jgi:hypothetical protein
MAGRRWMQVNPDGMLKICSEFFPFCHFEQHDNPIDLTKCGKCWFKCRGEAQGMLKPNRLEEYFRMFLKRGYLTRVPSFS